MKITETSYCDYRNTDDECELPLGLVCKWKGDSLKCIRPDTISSWYIDAPDRCTHPAKE